MRRTSFFALVFALTLTVLPAAGFAASSAAEVAGPPGSYIVVLDSGDPQRVADEHRRDHGAEVGHVYRHALQGYSARMSPQAAARVAADSRVDYVDVDRAVSITHHQCGHTVRDVAGPCPAGVVSGTVAEADGDVIAGATVVVDGKSATTDANGGYKIENVTEGTQTVRAEAEGFDAAEKVVAVSGLTTVDFELTRAAENDPPKDDPPATDYEVPLGLQRIFWDSSAMGKTYPGVAIIDTGIAEHADLPSLTDGYNCSSGPPHRWQDGNGHGTHVAGTVAAKGAIVGVAPDAPLYAVRVLNNNGSGSWSDVICGIDWVTANSVGNRGPISVANMSLGGSGTAGTSCASNSMRQAICKSVDKGVTYVTSAGNSAADAKGFVPAAYPETITVAAIADFDGEPDGQGSPTCRTDVDDTHANFSNYGTAEPGEPGHVDITAPGVCITSTWHDGGYRTISGTSMSGPHVAGAAALYLSSAASTARSPATVRAELKRATNDGYTYKWTKNGEQVTVPGIKPLLLDVGGL
jgi:subtilisin family serine protease